MRRVLIDTDPGVDDSMMLQFAFRSPDVRVEALTTVFGNADITTTTRNALVNCAVAGRRDVSVARGAAKPLKRPELEKYPTMIHGKDGLGDSNWTTPSEEGAALISTPAPRFIVERVSDFPGEITLLAVGPLTNLALALSLEPSIARVVKEVVIMGGAATVPGNATPVAEANIHCDPESARMVLHAGWPLTMVGLDVTTKICMTSGDLEEIYRVGTPATDFIKAISPLYLQRYRTRYGMDGMYVHDFSALAYILDASLFATEKVFVDVETQGELTTGQTVADFRNRYGKAPNVQLCLKVDSSQLIEMYRDTITSR